LSAGRTTPRAIWTLIGVETLCLLGSEISRFGVAVWIYRTTSSVSAFSALLLANTVPGMLAALPAGSIVDRSSRKFVMIGAAILSLIGSLIVFTGAAVGELSMPLVIVGACLASVAESFQWPALSASIPLMATEEDLPKYNGFLESGRAASMFAGPVIGGFLLAFAHLSGLVAIELVTFAIATIVVAGMFIPRPEPTAEGVEDTAAGVLADSVSGIKWIVAHKPLLKFLLVATFANFFISIGMVLMPPYGLSFLGERTYGISTGVFGAGMVVGGFIYGALSSRLKNIQQFLWTALVLGGVYVAYGFARDVISLSALNFLIAVIMTIGNAAIMTIWQTKVPEDLQGRVLSTMRLVADITIPVSFLIAGPLTDRFAPWAYDKANAQSLWGTTATGPMGAVFSVMGVILFIGFVIATSIRDVRNVEDLPV
jgi:DHA3 family macrolide efflux protein-like MFS transporter